MERKSYRYAVSKLEQICEEKSKKFKSERNKLLIESQEEFYEEVIRELRDLKDQYELLIDAINALNDLEASYEEK